MTMQQRYVPEYPPLESFLAPWPGAEFYSDTYLHAAKRLEERYGINMGMQEYKELCEYLWNTPVPIVAQGEKGRIIIRLRLHHTRVNAVWSPNQGVIITFLPSHGYGTSHQKIHEYQRNTQKLKERQHKARNSARHDGR